MELVLCLVTASAKARKRALCNLIKLGAPVRVLTPEGLINAQCRDEQDTRIVISMSKRMNAEPLQRERNDKLQTCALPKQKREILRAELSKWLLTKRANLLADMRIGIPVRPERE